MWLALLIAVSFSVSVVFSPEVWGQGRIWEKQDKEAFPGQKTRIWGQDSNALGTAMRWERKTQIYLLRMPKLTSDYRLGTGDELGIEIVGHDEFSGSYKINSSGEISISALGPVQAADLTGEELETNIATRFKEQQLIKDPEVLVYVIDFQAKPFYVLGEVDMPGQYFMTQELTLTEAILMAGGIDFGADRYGFLHRGMPQAGLDLQQLREHPQTAGPGKEVIKVDLKPLKEGSGILRPDIPLRAGDFFFVPTRKIEPFYVVGDVKNPGAYEIPKPAERSMLASQAVARAGGPTPTAKTKKGLLVRYDPDGKRSEQNFDFAAILKGDQKDFAIQPRDVIFIPGSHAKTLAYGLLAAIPQSVQYSTTENMHQRH